MHIISKRETSEVCFLFGARGFVVQWPTLRMEDEFITLGRRFL